ncbi:MAG: FAD-binding oxidoreductase [Candidatus Limnocylindrales bacterium]
MTSSPSSIARLGQSLTGEVIAPGDDAYELARRVWNARYSDRRPAIIVRPASGADVAASIRFARYSELEIAVRSGAHSNSGHSTTDGGLVIDMSAMRGVTVDPSARVARVNGGALLGELDVAAQAHGLVCPVGVIGHTGVAGLTLGGGIGRLQRNFGLTIDNLIAVELVTADGRKVRASATEEPELFWGMRGAGHNFGVATAFEFGLHPFDGILHRGVQIYPASQAHEVWSMVRDAAPRLADAVSMGMVIGRGVPAADYPAAVAGRPIVIVGYSHSGASDAVERDTAPLRAGPKPVFASEKGAEYLEVQTANDLAMGWGHRSIIESAYADDLRPATIDALVELAARAPDGATFSATVHGGAIARVADDAMAYTGRNAGFDLSADSDWDDAGQDELNVGWVREVMATVAPDLTLGRYLNGLCEYGPEQTRQIYGDAKLPRLAALKRAWDPDNVFRRNHNIAT